LALSVLATLYLGLLPNRALLHAQQSAQDLLRQPQTVSSGLPAEPLPAAPKN